MKCAVENWETDSNTDCLFSCCILSPLKYSGRDELCHASPSQEIDGSIFLFTALSLPAASPLFDRRTMIPYYTAITLQEGMTMMQGSMPERTKQILTEVGK